MGNKLIKGQNDFESWCKRNGKDILLKEWDYTVNSIFPSELSYGSHKVVSWICTSCGNKYEKSVHARAEGTGCGICSGVGVFIHRKSLFDEYPELVDELDFDKNTFESVKDVTSGSTKKIYWKCDKGHSYDALALNKAKGRGCPYCAGVRVLVGFNDLKSWCNNNNRLAIIQDWDDERNNISPTDITFGSNKSVFFRCHVCGYEWKARVGARTALGTDCPQCARRLSSSFPEQAIFYYFHYFFEDTLNGEKEVLRGYELDVFVPSKRIAIEYDGKNWHKDTHKDKEKDLLCKKKKIKLYRVRETYDSYEDFEYSKCYVYDYGNWEKLGHIIEKILFECGIKVNENDIDIERDSANIKEQYYRILRDNSLAIRYPLLAKEWHPTKNGSITPEMVSAESHDNYYWLCPTCGNSYKAILKNRVRVNSGCPKCGQKKRVLSQSIKVINLDTNEIFKSAEDAAQKYKMTAAAIRYCCNGKTKTSGGYRWEYDPKDLSESKARAREKRAIANSDKQQQVINIDTGEVYDSVLDAFNQTHIHNISACCRGVRGKAGGYHWAFLEKT